jgi:hypothetical protein
MKYRLQFVTHLCKMFRGSQKFIAAEVCLRFWSLEKLMRHLSWLQQERRCKGKGKIQPRTGGEDPERE